MTRIYPDVPLYNYSIAIHRSQYLVTKIVCTSLFNLKMWRLQNNTVWRDTPVRWGRGRCIGYLLPWWWSVSMVAMVTMFSLVMEVLPPCVATGNRPPVFDTKRVRFLFAKILKYHNKEKMTHSDQENQSVRLLLLKDPCTG